METTGRTAPEVNSTEGQPAESGLEPKLEPAAKRSRLDSEVCRFAVGPDCQVYSVSKLALQTFPDSLLNKLATSEMQGHGDDVIIVGPPLTTEVLQLAVAECEHRHRHGVKGDHPLHGPALERPLDPRALKVGWDYLNMPSSLVLMTRGRPDTPIGTTIAMVALARNFELAPELMLLIRSLRYCLPKCLPNADYLMLDESGTESCIRFLLWRNPAQQFGLMSRGLFRALQSPTAISRISQFVDASLQAEALSIRAKPCSEESRARAAEGELPCLLHPKCLCSNPPRCGRPLGACAMHISLKSIREFQLGACAMVEGFSWTGSWKTDDIELAIEVTYSRLETEFLVAASARAVADESCLGQVLVVDVIEYTSLDERMLPGSYPHEPPRHAQARRDFAAKSKGRPYSGRPPDLSDFVNAADLSKERHEELFDDSLSGACVLIDRSESFQSMHLCTYLELGSAQVFSDAAGPFLDTLDSNDDALFSTQVFSISMLDASVVPLLADDRDYDEFTATADLEDIVEIEMDAASVAMG